MKQKMKPSISKREEEKELHIDSMSADLHIYIYEVMELELALNYSLKKNPNGQHLNVCFNVLLIKLR